MYTVDKELPKHGAEPRGADAAQLALPSFMQGLRGGLLKLNLWVPEQKEFIRLHGTLQVHPSSHFPPPSFISFLPPFLLLSTSSLYQRVILVGQIDQ